MTTHAIPLFFGTFPKNSSKASRPPADAPIPTIGKLFKSEAGSSIGFKPEISF
jgi:hypothetical protein